MFVLSYRLSHHLHYHTSFFASSVVFLHSLFFVTEPSTTRALLFLQNHGDVRVSNQIPSADNDVDGLIPALLVTVGTEMEPCV